MMDRPGFVTGVALVANAVAREIFKVDASPEAIEAVQAVVEQHDSKGWWGQIVGADASGPGFDLSRCESSGNDWVDGYQEALTALAAAIEAVPLEPNSIAVVGMLLDRREADRRADYDELAGYLAALGLDFCGFFPAFDVVDSSQLKDIAPASTIISLPYGRKAAHAISKKTGAKLIELDQNRVNVVFEINEGKTTKVKSISFIGNRAFTDGQLRDIITTIITGRPSP